jgi:hypothetical protein
MYTQAIIHPSLKQQKVKPHREVYRHDDTWVVVLATSASTSMRCSYADVK